jgi:hypothetical protein
MACATELECLQEISTKLSNLPTSYPNLSLIADNTYNSYVHTGVIQNQISGIVTVVLALFLGYIFYRLINLFIVY